MHYRHWVGRNRGKNLKCAGRLEQGLFDVNLDVKGGRQRGASWHCHRYGSMLACSADWQSAVSPNGIRQVGGLPIRDTADCQSALRWQCQDAPASTEKKGFTHRSQPLATVITTPCSKRHSS